MHGLAGLLVPTIIVIALALIIVWCAERFSPDPLITKIVQCVVFVAVLVFLLKEFLPLLGIG